MHTYIVTLNSGDQVTIESERVQFTPTHIVFDNTQNALGFGRYELVRALRADTVLEVTEGDPPKPRY